MRNENKRRFCPECYQLMHFYNHKEDYRCEECEVHYKAHEGLTLQQVQSELNNLKQRAFYAPSLEGKVE